MPPLHFSEPLFPAAHTGHRDERMNGQLRPALFDQMSKCRPKNVVGLA